VTIVAIDPGLQGGIALLHSERDFTTHRMPLRRYQYYGFQKRQRAKEIQQVDVISLHWLVGMAHAEAIIVEQQTAMPAQSSVSTGSSFANYGLVLSLRLLAPVYVVPARIWKTALAVPRDKALAVQRCAELFSGFPVPGRDGEAEALMLALYWLRAGKADGTGPDSKQRWAGAMGRAKAVRAGVRAGAPGAGSAGAKLDRAARGRLGPAARPQGG